MQILNHALYNDASLKAYYRLENANDSKGSYHLTTTNSFIAGKHQNCMSCVSAGAELSADPGVVGTSAWGMAGWYKNTAGDIPSDQNIWYLSDAGNMVSAGIRYEYNGGTRRLDFWRDKTGPGTAHARYVVNLNDGKWHHVAITYDGTNILGYLDGVLVASTTQSGNGTNPTTDWIRLAYTGSYGLLDDVGFFAKTLSLAEIQSLYADVGAGILGLLT